MFKCEISASIKLRYMIFQLLMLAIILLCFIFRDVFIRNDVIFILILFLFYYFYCLLSSFIFVRKTSLYSLFLFCYFVFYLGGVVISPSSVFYVHSIVGVKEFSSLVVIESLYFYFLTLSLIQTGFCFSLFVDGGDKKTVSFNYGIFYFARICFFITLPFCLLKFYYEINTIRTIGYVGYYSIGVDMPFMIKLSRYFFEISFLLILASMPNYRRFKFYSILFMVVMSLFLIVGVRSKFILYFIFCFWFYYRFYSRHDMKISLILLSMLMVIGVLILSQLYRQGWVFNSDDNYVKYFFKSQSISFNILPLTIEYIDKFKATIPVIFSPFKVDSLLYSSQGIGRLENVNLLGDVISYNLLGDLYFDGNGIGGSFTAELYQSGIFIAVFLSFTLGFFINSFDVLVKRYRFLIAISFFVVSNVAYMPRSSFFKEPYMLLFFILCYFSFLVIVKYVSNIKRNAWRA